MSRVTEISKGVFLQQDTQSPAQMLPADSVVLPMLDPTLRSQLLRPNNGYAYVVGQSADVSVGNANYSSLDAAIAALGTSDGTIRLLPGSYTLAAASISTRTNTITLVGSGIQTLINGAITFDTCYAVVRSLRFTGNVTFTAASTSNFVTECWQTAASTLTDLGTGNFITLLDV